METDGPGVHRPRRRTLLIGAAVLIAAVVLIGRASSHRLVAGVSIGGQLADEAPALVTSDLDRVRDTGATWIRLDVSWNLIQDGGPDRFDWRRTDLIIGEARRRGLRVLAVLVNTPPWARPAGTDGKWAPPPAAYAAFVRRAVARYAGFGVHDWEVWNEPNNDAFFKPRADPAAYARLLIAGSKAIRAADPRATVVSGGLSPAVTAGGDIAPVTFLQGVYAAGARGAFDAVGHHPYSFPAYPEGTNARNAWHQMSGTDPSLRSVMVDHGDGGKRIWATEFGAPTGGPPGQAVSEAAQAEQISRAVALWRACEWAGPLFVYSMRDLGTDPRTREDWFGLVRHDGSPKPALRAFTEATGGR